MALQDGEKRSFVQRLFTSIAPRYDRFNRLASCGLDQRWRSEAIRLGDVRPGQRVLDVCAGTGDLAILCARRQEGQGIVVGMDLNAQMLSWARRKQRQQRPFDAAHGLRPWALAQGRPERGEAESKDDEVGATGSARGDPHLDVAWLLGDAEALPFAEATFDRVTIGFSTRNLSDLTGGLREMVRVLRPNGRLIILETGRPSHPLMWMGYQLFLWTFVRAMGLMVTGQLWPFTYFARSVRAFLTPQQLTERLQRLATQVQYVPLSHGLASLFLATKS
ncbi:MAG: class I SAM-dependent methyltransferase [Candidatus Omnitrophota bacterium]|nr:class I SAM-dependent methyltransferase [Candidatus Omnitrophota bacterium]